MGSDWSSGTASTNTPVGDHDEVGVIRGKRVSGIGGTRCAGLQSDSHSSLALHHTIDEAKRRY